MEARQNRRVETHGCMRAFMEPESVAIIGISRRTGPGSYNLMENMLRYGFRGKIFPVNPYADEVLGIKAYPNIKEVGEKIDLAIITLPRELVLKSLEDCAQAGVRAVIVVGQGFADADAKGKTLQNALAALGKEKGVRILGPNTLGVVNNFKHFTTSFMPLVQEAAPIGVICQSGIFFVGAKNFSGRIGKGIDIGNACDIGFCESLGYLGNDPDIRLIVMHIEGLDCGREFFALGSEVTHKKPVIVLKTGRSETGARAAESHSGSMAGDYNVYQAALTQAGFMLIREEGKVNDAVRTLLHQPLMKGHRVAVMTITGAAGIMASDALERYGLKLASLSQRTLHAVGRLSPPWMPLGNPLDIWPAVMKHGMKEVYPIALKEVLADPAVDAVLCITVAPKLPDFDFLDVSQELNDATAEEIRKPVVAWLYGPDVEEMSRRYRLANRITVYDSIETAAWSLALLRKRQLFLDKQRG